MTKKIPATTEQLDNKKVKAEALKLVRDSSFLHRSSKKISGLGVVGERTNVLILVVAGLTKDSDSPVSVLAKGQSSSGKSNLMRNSLKLFPPESLISRASLSAKAPAHGEGSLSGKILYLFEYRGGKDAQYLLRLQQSEKTISHEYATVKGSERGTKISEREGSPVVFTTTTEKKVFADDENRFLSVWIDDSPEQTLKIMQKQIGGVTEDDEADLSVWQEAIRLIGRRNIPCRFPSWFGEIAALVPKERVRVRRDWERFLALCKIGCRIRSFSAEPDKQPEELVVNFSDYCVTHRIVNAALASTLYALNERELSLANSVRDLHKIAKKPITVSEVASHLGWKESLVYKYLDPAIKHDLIKELPGKRQSNQKLLEPVAGAETGFLPPPDRILKKIDAIKEEARFTDPITGKSKVIARG